MSRHKTQIGYENPKTGDEVHIWAEKVEDRCRTLIFNVNGEKIAFTFEDYHVHKVENGEKTDLLGVNAEIANLPA